MNWSQAQDLPDGVSTRWRDGESLRRAAEERAAGRTRTILRGFLAPGFCEVLLREVQALPQQRLDTEAVHAWRHAVRDGLHSLREILSDPLSRRLLGAVLGAPLSGDLVVNTWRLERGDRWPFTPRDPATRPPSRSDCARTGPPPTAAPSPLARPGPTAAWPSPSAGYPTWATWRFSCRAPPAATRSRRRRARAGPCRGGGAGADTANPGRFAPTGVHDGTEQG